MNKQDIKIDKLIRRVEALEKQLKKTNKNKSSGKSSDRADGNIVLSCKNISTQIRHGDLVFIVRDINDTTNNIPACAIVNETNALEYFYRESLPGSSGSYVFSMDDGHEPFVGIAQGDIQADEIGNVMIHGISDIRVDYTRAKLIRPGDDLDLCACIGIKSAGNLNCHIKAIHTLQSTSDFIRCFITQKQSEQYGSARTYVEGGETYLKVNLRALVFAPDSGISTYAYSRMVEVAPVEFLFKFNNTGSELLFFSIFPYSNTTDQRWSWYNGGGYTLSAADPITGSRQKSGVYGERLPQDLFYISVYSKRITDYRKLGKIDVFGSHVGKINCGIDYIKSGTVGTLSVRNLETSGRFYANPGSVDIRYNYNYNLSIPENTNEAVILAFPKMSTQGLSGVYPTLMFYSKWSAVTSDGYLPVCDIQTDQNGDLISLESRLGDCSTAPESGWSQVIGVTTPSGTKQLTFRNGRLTNYA
jgi:hypothetical protein